MGFAYDYWNRYTPLSAMLNGNFSSALYRMTPLPMLADLSGYTQYKNTQKSLQSQMDYEQYLKAGNERALRDWQNNVGKYGRTIRYPELSYAGQIYRANTSFARSGFDYDSASANYYGNLPYRSAGLYGIASRFSRYL